MDKAVKIMVLRADRRTISMKIQQDGSVTVCAPKGMSDKEIDEFIAKHRRWLEKHVAGVLSHKSREDKLTETDVKNLRQIAKEILVNKTIYYAKLMGVAPTGVKITSAKTRFGSCSGKNSICYSWRLMLYPERAIDYVVVHELAHIKHKDHSGDFYYTIEKVMPDYKERARLLKE